MVAVVRSTVVDAPIDAVWRVLRDFNSHVLWHPRILTSEIEQALPADAAGCVRRFRLTDGAELREQLIALSDRERSFTYCILESPIPLLDYVATVRLRPVTDGDRTIWEWRSSFRTPPGQESALADLVAREIYGAGFSGLRAYLAEAGESPPVAAAAPRRALLPPSRDVIEAAAIVVRAHGGPEVLVLDRLRVPPPGPGEVRLQHTAIGVNYLDIHARTGHYPLLTPPAVPGVEAAGVVTEVGDGVVHLVAGDRVAYACLPAGSYCAVRTMVADRLVVLPPAIDDETAAAAMLKGMTAEYLLHRTHRVGAGDIVLVHAAAGGVGLLLCQWAKHLGAIVIGTVGKPDKVHLARAAGCDYPICGPLADLPARVAEITRGRGADVIYDGIGQETFAASFAALAMRGHLVLHGEASGMPEPIAHAMLARKSATVTRPALFHYTADGEELRAMAGNLFRMIETGALKVSVNQRYPLAEAAEAHRALEGRRTTGSTILLP
jgi:NADPH:quinone reductase